MHITWLKKMEAVKKTWRPCSLLLFKFTQYGLILYKSGDIQCTRIYKFIQACSDEKLWINWTPTALQSSYFTRVDLTRVSFLSILFHFIWTVMKINLFYGRKSHTQSMNNNIANLLKIKEVYFTLRLNGEYDSTSLLKFQRIVVNIIMF